MRPHPVLLTVLVAATGLLAACGDPDVERPAAAPTEVPPTEVPQTEVATTPPAPVLVEIVDVYPDVEYYGACGNETVEVDGTMYYPLLDDERAALDETLYPLEVVDPGQSGLMRVAPPGPGDDIGTMIVYRDGLARFESQSGRVLWLTDQERTYNWVC